MSENCLPISIRPYRRSDQNAVVDLWHACDLIVPQNDPVQDIECKLAVQPELFLVGMHDFRLVATVMAGYDGHRGWINYLAVHPECRRQGLGRQMMMSVEEKLGQLGCPKINLQVRDTNAAVIAFYKRLGFVIDAVVSMGKRLSS